MASENSDLTLTSWREEKGSAFLYSYMAKYEKGTEREVLFHRLAEAAESQALFWAEQHLKQGGVLPLYKPTLRIKLVAFLIQYLGPRSLKPVLAAMKVRGLAIYAGEMPGHPMPKEVGKNQERQHRAIGSSGTLRAAVFGINDGLVSNSSLILGIAGAAPDNMSLIILTGIAGLGAGAFSMAAGEYISMKSQRELFEHQIALEQAELEQYPEEEIAELSYIYQARGLSQSDATEFARKLLANKEHALDILAREELGLNPDELGSPWGAALSSFIAFGFGAVVPLIPFLFNFGSANFTISIILSGSCLFIVGVALSLFTGRNALLSGLRMLLIGVFAGIATFGIGKLVGVNIG